LLLDGRYRVIKELGKGGFGKTYEVTDSNPDLTRETHSICKVLKVLNLNHPKYVELFQREANFLVRFNHPGIPKVEPDAYFTYFPYNSANPLHCLVMEKIEGLDLKHYIEQRGACISQKRAIKWLIQLVHILREIHNDNFFHRDIKPSNIMLRADGQLVLIDFGTAREVTETYMSKQSEGQVTGLFSAGYSPMEQLNGQAIPQSDFFALGRTMVFLLTGQNPSELYDFDSDQLKWRDYVSDLDPRFADFLDCMMARIPSQRPQSADAMFEQLMKLYHLLYAGEGSSTSQTQQPTSSSSPPANYQKTSLDSTVSSVSPSNSSPSPSLSPKLPTDVQATLVEMSAESPPLSPSIPSSPPLDPAFLSQCQQELVEFIGPVAAIIFQRLIKKNPQISSGELVKELATKIPDPKQAEIFKRRWLNY
jgi:serine/threonine protein kinase